MAQLTREVLAEEALFILKSLRENAQTGKTSKMTELQGMARSVSLDLGDYLLFLRKNQYITLDPVSSTLGLTSEGERIAEGQATDGFSSRLYEFFAPRLSDSSDMPADVEVTQVRHATTVGQAPRGPKPPAPPKDSMEEGLAAGGYVRYESIGSGSVATVYRGKHNSLGVEVAIKELKDLFSFFSFLQRNDVIRRLKKELAAQGALRHPCVLEVMDQNCDVAKPYWVLEHAPNGSLRSKLDEAKGPLPLDAAMHIFLQCCFGLKAAHAAGLTHQSLKPEDILFDARDNVKLSDFGLARVMESEVMRQLPNVSMGTAVGYLAPELLGKKGDATPQSDLYALGIILYEMLTGQIPGRRSPLPSMAAEGTPVGLDPIFDKLTQDKKEQRYIDVDAVLSDFYGVFPDGRYGRRNTILLYSDGMKAEPGGPPSLKAKKKPGS
jgi:serine/threonine protein kinase